MITNFQTDSEKKFLYDLLWRGIMSTDLIFNEIQNIEEYKKHLVRFREQCFEYLQEEDPDIAAIKKFLNEKPKTDS